jgi:hypothetical protein
VTRPAFAQPPASADATEKANQETAGAETAGAETAGAEVDAWVQDLGSDQYVRRERASRQLYKAGPRVVPALEAAIREGDLETTERALQILQVIAMQQEPGSPALAWDALHRLIETGSGNASTRARDLVGIVRDRREARAREALRGAGVPVELNGFLLQAMATNSEVVHVTDSWNGDLQALSWLSWLYDIEYALLEGASIDADVIERLTAMPDLRNVVFTKTDVEATALSPLRRLQRLDSLELRYVPIGDPATDQLAQLPLRQSLSLIGTKISPDGVASLREALPGLKIDFKRGGFLGVECHSWAVRCEISRVIPGGAADRAGLRARDVITRVDDAKIERFDDLQKAIGMHAPDDPVTITFERLGQVESTELTLGRLPSAPQ